MAAPCIPYLGMRTIFKVRFRTKAPNEFLNTNFVNPAILRVGPAAPKIVWINAAVVRIIKIWGYNIGYNYFEHDPADLSYSLVLGIAVNEQISTYFEPYGQINDFNTLNTDWESNVNMGITYLLTDNIQLDYAFGTGLNYKFNFMSIGCSVNLF